MDNSTYYSHLTPEEKRNLDMGHHYQRAVSDFWMREVKVNVGPLITAIAQNVPDLDSVEEFEEVRDLLSRSDWTSPAEEEGACIVRSSDGEYFYFNYSELSSIEVDKATEAMIDFTALAKHLGLDIDSHVYDEDSSLVSKLPADKCAPNAYLDSLDATCSDGEEVLEGLALLAQYQHNDHAQEMISGALRNKDKAAKLLGDFVNPDFTAADTFDSDSEAAQGFCESNNIDPDEREVYEHYAISEWMASKLSERGEATAEVANLTIWGRCTTGQMVCMDGIINQIFREECGFQLDEVIKADLPEVAARIDAQLAAEQEAKRAKDADAPTLG